VLVGLAQIPNDERLSRLSRHWNDQRDTGPGPATRRLRVMASPAQRSSWVDIAVGRNVRIWRMAKGLTQAQLADRVGVTFQQLQKYEIGGNRIPTGRLVKLAGILGVPISALFEGTNGAEPPRSLLALISDSRSFRLARAFAAIENGAMRLSLVSLVEKIAIGVPQTKRGRK
jgi:transcriptional regulator with XRE-family HTH domain